MYGGICGDVLGKVDMWPGWTAAGGAAKILGSGAGSLNAESTSWSQTSSSMSTVPSGVCGFADEVGEAA